MRFVCWMRCCYWHYCHHHYQEHTQGCYQRADQLSFVLLVLSVRFDPVESCVWRMIVFFATGERTVHTIWWDYTYWIWFWLCQHTLKILLKTLSISFETLTKVNMVFFLTVCPDFLIFFELGMLMFQSVSESEVVELAGLVELILRTQTNCTC